jgi:cytochrome P450
MGTERTDAPPGPSGLPLVGNTHQYVGRPLSFYEELATEYGPVARYELGGETFVQLSAPDLVGRVLAHDHAKFRKGAQYQTGLAPVLGDGLLLAEGDDWRRQRRRMQPDFDPDALASYAPTMVAYTDRLLERWRDGEVRDLHADMTTLTIEIVARALFDVDVRDHEADVATALGVVMDRARTRLRRPLQVPDPVPTPGKRRYRRAIATLQGVAGDILADADPAMDGDTVVDTLLAVAETTDDLTRERVRDEVVTLLLAGHETTALALTYTVNLLARSERPAGRLRTELDDVLGGDAPTHDDVDDLPFVRRTVREGMRVYPPVQELLREAAELVELGGYRFPEGTTFSMQQWVLHRDERFYDDPETFRPSRWTDAMRADLPSFAYFPFGAGPRRCIGDSFAKLEAHLALARMAQDWTFEAVSGAPSFEPSITNRPADPVRVRVNRR